MSDIKMYEKNGHWIMEYANLPACVLKREGAMELAKAQVKRNAKMGIKTKIYVSGPSNKWVEID